MFKLWEDSIVFERGLYVYCDGHGNNSVISKDCANEIEKNYQKYQASMDVCREGRDRKEAYKSRGLDENGSKLLKYETDDLPKYERVIPIEGKWIIPERVVCNQINSIYKRAFLNCSNLVELTIPKSVTSIGEEAFFGCDNLKKIDFQGDITSIASGVFKSTLLYKDESNWCGESLYINNWLIKVSRSYKGSFIVKENTVGIADNAFEDCDEIEEVSIPESVKYVGNEVFKNCCKLKDVHFPEQVILFGAGVLGGCNNIKNIKLPYGVEKISGFKGSNSLEKVSLPDSVKVIDRYAFKDCTSLNEIHLSSNLECIGDEAFKNTAYVNNNDNWKDGILYIEDWLIKANDDVNKEVVINEGTKGIADCAFTKNMLSENGINVIETVDIPDSVENIGKYAFNGCKNLTNVNIPKRVKCLSGNVFSFCHSLKEIVIPLNVEELKDHLFFYCVNLKKIIIENPNIKIEWPALCCDNATIYSGENSNAEKYAKKYKMPFSIN